MSLFRNLTRALEKAANDVRRDVERTASSVVRHAEAVIKDPMTAVTAIPGVALNAALWVPHAAAQAVGRGVEIVGDVTGNKDVRAVGKTIHETSTAIVKGSIADPIGSAQILGGVGLIATGLGGPAGAALLTSGTASVLGSSSSEVVKGFPQQVDLAGPSMPLVGAPVPAKPTEPVLPPRAPSSEPGPTRVEPTWWAQLVAFVRNLFANLTLTPRTAA